MEITLEEQRLLAEFRRLSPHQRQELLAIAHGLATTAAPAPPGDGTRGQCALGQGGAARSAGNDPVFTE